MEETSILGPEKTDKGLGGGEMKDENLGMSAQGFMKDLYEDVTTLKNLRCIQAPFWGGKNWRWTAIHYDENCIYE